MDKEQLVTADSPSMSVQQLNEKLAEAGGMPKQTEKQRKKQEEQQKKYWNTMITRKEAYELVDKATENLRQQTQMLYIQIQSITKHLVDSGSITMEQLDDISKVVISEIFGNPPTQEEVANEEPTN